MEPYFCTRAMAVFSPTPGTPGILSEEPLPSATVKLLKTDSTLVKGVLTNVNGGFKVTAPADGRYILRVSCVGFKNYTKRITVSGGKDVALGKISLKSDAIMLKGATVTANVAKVTAKADTLEYNAAAYRTPEGSAIEELVKRLPGVTVSGWRKSAAWISS